MSYPSQPDVSVVEVADHAAQILGATPEPEVVPYLERRPDVAACLVDGAQVARRLFGAGADYYLAVDVDHDSGEECLLLCVVTDQSFEERQRLRQLADEEWGYRALGRTRDGILLMVGAR